MFESDPAASHPVAEVDRYDAVACADALHDTVLLGRALGARRLRLAAHWADLHHPDHRRGREGVVRRRLGGDGTPEVAYPGVAELGVLLQVSTGTASRLLADALDLRHRLPLVWAAVMALELDDWKARKVAGATRHLSAEQAASVDTGVVTALTGLPFGRAWIVVEARIIGADPAGHAARLDARDNRRYLALGRRDLATGLQSLHARGPVGDITRLMAMVTHLADLLAGDGRDASGSTAEERRVTALTLLANPALACAFLARHHGAGQSIDAGSRHAGGADDGRAVGESALTDATALGRALAAGGPRLLERLRPRTVLRLHLDASAVLRHPAKATVVRLDGLSPLTTTQLRDHLRGWLGSDTVTVTPVVYPLEHAAVDQYELPRPLEEALHLREPYEVFPYGTLPSTSADDDHTVPYQHPTAGGPAPPGQTGLHNLGPLSRAHHNAKTHHGFAVHQPTPGVYYWRLPTGRWYRVDRTGTRHLGTSTPPEIVLAAPLDLEVDLSRLHALDLRGRAA